MSTVIKVENLSKRYRLGLKEARKDTLFQQIGHTLTTPIRNFRRLRSMTRFDQEDESVFWALRDINFEVKQGEVLGIIGHNGAGKSTLLKLLSRITEPTTGRITLKGRVAALLEVGTGFHQDLTGRENIYMNGTILGMTKKEIDRKLDEIVDFSGVEQHLDTPVKFYSSGMKVRLGFSVAAHLEPEILIIDEVLAVGDVEFQKKCLGKIGDVATSGRTVLFVSHNMTAIQSLCSKAILINNGMVAFSGSPNDVIQKYIKPSNRIKSGISDLNGSYIKKVIIKNTNSEITPIFKVGDSIIVEVFVEGLSKISGCYLGFFIKDYKGTRLASYSTAMNNPVIKGNRSIKEKFTFKISRLPFVEGHYNFDITASFKVGGRVEYIENAISFDILTTDLYDNKFKLDNYFGYVFLDSEAIIQSWS